ncbi:hypothetical protein [Halostreptopolyspora alba]|uniref:hypothetical protein n=1 Tax=Halostreptopolyspora alba TaxID=2487137 RepID=UPI0011CDB646
MSETCAIDCCPAEPVVVLSYAARSPRSYLLCEPHRREAHRWVRSRFGDIAITEQDPEAVQPALFTSEEARS